MNRWNPRLRACCKDPIKNRRGNNLKKAPQKKTAVGVSSLFRPTLLSCSKKNKNVWSIARLLAVSCFIDCIDNVYDWSRHYFDFAWKSRIIHKTRESTTNHNTQISFPCMDVFKLKRKCKKCGIFLSNIRVRHIDATHSGLCHSKQRAESRERQRSLHFRCFYHQV